MAITLTILAVLSVGSRGQQQQTPSLADALRTGEPLRTASSLRNVCQAFMRVQSAQDSNDYRRVKQTDFQDAGHCMGYVTGWMDTFSEQLSCVGGQLYTVKFVGGVRVSQVIRLFMQYIDGHTEREQDGAANVLGRTLGEKGIIGSFSVPFSECKQ